MQSHSEVVGVFKPNSIVLLSLRVATARHVPTHEQQSPGCKHRLTGVFEVLVRMKHQTGGSNRLEHVNFQGFTSETPHGCPVGLPPESSGFTEK